MLPKTFGALKKDARFQRRARLVKDEIRRNVLARLAEGGPMFPGIVGYDETALPSLINALLARHDFILLGLRGQAKSRILRGLTEFLDELLPFIAGSEIHDDPFDPITEEGRRLVAEAGDDLPVEYLNRQDRYVEKLATPDVTIADLIGDLDPIKAAKTGRELSAFENVHFGLLPRAHRGIFAINELPDLAPKLQVGLFNILQEGDVQIKGYPLRLPLDLLVAFTANPDDYTARGKIITPLKDRIGAEIRTHYPRRLKDGVAITRQEAWTDRQAGIQIPDFIDEIVEEIAFLARRDGRIDQRSGVSQRLSISCIEFALSNAERRAQTHDEDAIAVRTADVHASLPAITGKLELEYEGEMKGAERIARELIAGSILSAFRRRFRGQDFERIVQWFELGGSILVDDQTSATDLCARVEDIQGLSDLLSVLGPPAQPGSPIHAAFLEFILEGLSAEKRISRNAERGFHREAPRAGEDLVEEVVRRQGGFN